MHFNQISIYLVYLVDDFLNTESDLRSYKRNIPKFGKDISISIFCQDILLVANYPRSGRGAAVYGTLGGLRGIFTEATNFGPSPAAALPAGHCRNSKYFGNTEQTQRVTRPQYTVAQRSLIPKNIYSKKQKHISEIQIPSQHM